MLTWKNVRNGDHLLVLMKRNFLSLFSNYFSIRFSLSPLLLFALLFFHKWPPPFHPFYNIYLSFSPFRWGLGHLHFFFLLCLFLGANNDSDAISRTSPRPLILNFDFRFSLFFFFRFSFFSSFFFNFLFSLNWQSVFSFYVLFYFQFFVINYLKLHFMVLTIQLNEYEKGVVKLNWIYIVTLIELLLV